MKKGSPSKVRDSCFALGTAKVSQRCWSTAISLNKGWYQRRIDFQPYPFASYTEELVRVVQKTKVEGDNAFLSKLDPRFVARDLVDDRFVRKAIASVGGPAAFGLPADLLRKEVLAV